VVFAATVAVWVNPVHPAPVHRSIAKILSSLLLSCQVRAICDVEVAVVTKFVGAAGGPTLTVTALE
jgi:hypothetical protein